MLYQPAASESLNATALALAGVPELSGGGLFVDLASHTLTFSTMFSVQFASVHGLASNQAGLYSAEDIVTAPFALSQRARSRLMVLYYRR